ncbi:hypothetical protein [Aequorivita viscosa]|uniref:hypothetical protein n=1 Tax=Aequorivita viscosa TaxID=797419 RepID=UPI0009327FE1|nr:hypothetical protein [Aequorivita viscosa]
MEFNVQWNNEIIKPFFNKDLHIPTIPNISNQMKREGPKLILENLDETYFGAIYSIGTRET